MALPLLLLVGACAGSPEAGGAQQNNEAGGNAAVQAEDPSGARVVADVTQPDSSAPATAGDVPVGFTEDGFPYRGDPDAPITVVEYSDYQCPFCARFATEVQPELIESYGATGKVQFVFRDFPIASLHPAAAAAHVATLCVAEQGADLYWQMHDRLFGAQAEWSAVSDLDAYLGQTAASIGVDPEAFDACMVSGAKQQLVEEGIASAQAAGFNGTPSFQLIANESGASYDMIGAQPAETFGEWLDAMLAGEAPPQEPTPAPPELPYWANEEGLAPDPDQPGRTMAGDPFQGDPDASLVVVEFTDYQCPSCGRHALEAMPVIVEQLVDGGDVMWVTKHLPLPEHPQAAAAAAAAECAADQERFHDMQEALFETVDEWSVEPPDAALLDVAARLDLDIEAFGACLEGRGALERVMSDVFDAQGVVQNTPTFIAIYGGTGTVLRGALPADELVDQLTALLEEAVTSESSSE